MNERLIMCAALPLCLAAAGRASAFELPAITAVNVRARSTETPAVPQPRPPAREWTVMAFINAKNNLEEAGLKDLNEMETAGSTDKVALVAELGRVKGYYDGDGDWTGVRRYLVQKDHDPGRVTSPVLADLGHADMGDYRTVMDFVRWAKTAYPAKKYMLIIWNHGSGWTRAAAGDRGISYDDESGGHINTPQLGAILRETGGADVYASDACLMQMAEVAWEIKDYASYIVGSEETEPADGYPYDAFLGALVADPGMAPQALAAALVRSYGEFYTARGTGATLSAVSAAALPEFLGLTNAFTSALIAAGDRGVVKRGMYYAQHYSYEDNKDLDSFVRYVAAKSASPAVRDAGAALLAYLRGGLVPYKAAANYSQTPDGLDPVDYTQAGGLAVYLPGTAAAPGYTDLKWAKDSSWNAFLAWIVHK